MPTLSRTWLPALSLLVGAAILIGQDARFQVPALSVPREWAPWWAWGIALVVSGLLQYATGHWLAVFAGSLPFGTFTLALALSAAQDPPIVPFTGVAVYGWVTAWHVRLAVKARHAD